MPYKSQAQSRYFHWAEAHGKLPKGTAHRWAAHTPSIKALPQKKAVLSGGLMGMQLGNQAANAPALAPTGPGDMGKPPTGVPPIAAKFPGPLTDGSKGLFGLRKSPVPGRGFPPSVANMNGQLKPTT